MYMCVRVVKEGAFVSGHINGGFKRMNISSKTRRTKIFFCKCLDFQPFLCIDVPLYFPLQKKCYTHIKMNCHLTPSPDNYFKFWFPYATS